MRKVLILVLLLGATLFASEVHWAKNFDSAIAQAKKENKPVLFIFSRHTCKYCKILEKTTLSDKRVIKALNKDFISYTAYSDDGDKMPKELWRPGTPTIWFLLPSSQPMYQPIMGAIDAKNFLNALGIVKQTFDKNKKHGK